MKNIMKGLLVFGGLLFSTLTYAQTDMERSSSADSAYRTSPNKMQQNQTYADSTMHPDQKMRNRAKSDSTQMQNDRRRNPVTMPADSSRTRKPNDRMMQRDSLK